MDLFNELVLISLEKQASFSNTPSDNEWMQIFDEAKKQSLTGFCFTGIEHLPREQRPGIKLLMNWIGQTEYIKRQNELVSRRAKEVTMIFAQGDLRSVVLKGQGVAMLYPNPKRRTSGDVDLWVDGERKKVINFIKEKRLVVGRTVVHHTNVIFFPDVSVEIHHIPSYTYNPLRWRKYQTWFREQAKVQFQLMDKSAGFAYPSICFNLVYSLLHIFRHVFHEGIGLRQLLDYYFILLHAYTSDRNEAMNTLHWFELDEFVGAVMYVEKEFFHLDDKFLLCEPCTQSGQFLLTEILQGGNFGKYDERTRKAHQGGDMHLYLMNVKRLMKMIHYYPSEVLWAPLWKPIHQIWRWTNGY